MSISHIFSLHICLFCPNHQNSSCVVKIISARIKLIICILWSWTGFILLAWLDLMAWKLFTRAWQAWNNKKCRKSQWGWTCIVVNRMYNKKCRKLSIKAYQGWNNNKCPKGPYWRGLTWWRGKMTYVDKWTLEHFLPDLAVKTHSSTVVHT